MKYQLFILQSLIIKIFPVTSVLLVKVKISVSLWLFIARSCVSICDTTILHHVFQYIIHSQLHFISLFLLAWSPSLRIGKLERGNFLCNNVLLQLSGLFSQNALYPAKRCDKVFKDRPSEIRGRHPLKICSDMVCLSPSNF